ncbi:hypothetical protein [Pseudogemmobacter humi]|uniref:Uncharacterized protein n=1 Tax=Pseudogemmobacter humi TaxID=2483812 RepID=A0A3P5XTQ0_9RHOB|nr:hypothetical protein [Pseudogemmobacter humi]VDC31404.1 hypothetical protein XINFAN_02875 [Pseudogemmobacter humi]
MQFSVSSNIDEVLRSLDDFTARQVPQAIAWALNDTADLALKGVQDDMDAHFDRPTRWTKNAFMVWRANKRKLVAEVKERPSVGRKHYLKVQERGGPRPQTGLERLFNTRMAYAGHIQSVIPAAAALRDAFGNWSVGERNRVLSSVRAQSDRAANSTKASKVRRKNASQFFVPRLDSRLSPGVWKRTSRGAALKKVVHFSQAVPKYRKRLGFIDGAEARVRKEFPRFLARALEKAIRTAR